MNEQQTLQHTLEKLTGISKVYFSPPESVKLIYPCVVYSRKQSVNSVADDSKYLIRHGYTITVITKDITMDLDLELFDMFKHISEESSFFKDGLYHKLYNIYI